MPSFAPSLPPPYAPAPWQGLGAPYPTGRLELGHTAPSRPLTGPVRQQNGFQQKQQQTAPFGTRPPVTNQPQRTALETAALLNAALTAPTVSREWTPTSSLPPGRNNLGLPLAQPQQAPVSHSPVLSSPVPASETAAQANIAASDKRTPGTWLFDTMLYPVLTNFGVFAISVAATYMTQFGPDGNFLKKRGDWMMNVLTKRLKVPEPVAYYGKMLFFSFADGCIMAPVVKLFEDRRKPISQSFDKVMGTKPDDPSIYDQEPKQTWGSVLKGRLVASASIIPPFILLTKKYGSDKTLNERIFHEPAKKITPWVEKTMPKLAKWFPGKKLPGIIETSIFEAVFTSITTGALYLSSRFFADSTRPDAPDPTTLATV